MKKKRSSLFLAKTWVCFFVKETFHRIDLWRTKARHRSSPAERPFLAWAGKQGQKNEILELIDTKSPSRWSSVKSPLETPPAGQKMRFLMPKDSFFSTILFLIHLQHPDSVEILLCENSFHRHFFCEFSFWSYAELLSVLQSFFCVKYLIL